MKSIYSVLIALSVISLANASHMVPDYERCKYVDDCSNP